MFRIGERTNRDGRAQMAANRLDCAVTGCDRRSHGCHTSAAPVARRIRSRENGLRVRMPGRPERRPSAAGAHPEAVVRVEGNIPVSIEL